MDFIVRSARKAICSHGDQEILLLGVRELHFAEAPDQGGDFDELCGKRTSRCLRQRWWKGESLMRPSMKRFV